MPGISGPISPENGPKTDVPGDLKDWSSSVSLRTANFACESDFTADCQDRLGAPLETSWYSTISTDLPVVAQAMSICFYSFCCHVNLFSTKKELKNDNPQRVGKVIRRSIAFMLFLYIIVGVCGYISIPFF